MILRALVVALTLAALGFGQLPRGFYPWWDQPIAKNLNLTEAQKAEVKSVVREYRTKLIEQRAALEKAEAELQYLFDDDNVDAKRANQAIEDLANARLNLTRTFSQVFLKVRLVLTPQQWHELQKRHDERVEQRRLKKQ